MFEWVCLCWAGAAGAAAGRAPRQGWGGLGTPGALGVNLGAQLVQGSAPASAFVLELEPSLG